MKFREMFLKYYAPHTENDGGAAAYEAMQNGNSQEATDDTPDTDPNEQDHDNDNDVDTDLDEQDLDENGKPKAKEGGENAETEDEEEEFLFDGQPVTAAPTDEDDQEGDSDLVKHLRAQLREQKKQFKTSTQAAQERKEIPADMPRKPEMGDEGIDWDPEKYAEALDKWTEDKAAYQQREQEMAAKREAFGKKFSEGQQRYQTERAKAIKKYAGFEKAEAAIAELPEPLQAGLMINSKNPAALVMVLGRNADLRKQVEDAYNSDHIALGYLIRDIEARAGSKPKAKQNLNSTPEVKGQNGVANVGQLEALRKRAEATGDYTEYFAAKNKRAEK
ncbi:hypothetical protein [Salmonella phage Lumpael]|uniref:Scaffolding protein n=1 Tax=Salmonella phage Lumpael TaxID=2488859 RepID=A0A3G8F5X9_9CAUD|nr:head scaffolding protein [Salmonella phage Lumpael]AZF88799.1 hypothetical protein [Salmonella phage Lumpael]